jgi:hypothetical protein
MRMPESPTGRRAATIERELQTRTTRLAGMMQGEFNTDDAKDVSTNQFHDMIRTQWADPEWRIATAQRIGPVSLYKAALEAFGTNHDGTPSIDSHPDAKAAIQPESMLKPPPDPPEPAAPPVTVFPTQAPAPGPPGMPVPPPPTPPPGTYPT